MLKPLIKVHSRTDYGGVGEGATLQALRTARADEVPEAPCVKCGSRRVILNAAMPRQITCDNYPRTCEEES